MTSAEPSEGTSSTSDTDRMVATESAVNILAQGKRNMVCGEIPTAVNQFQEACKILAKAYGETAKECADAYFCYGQALLDLARMENGVLGNALQGVPDTDEDENSEKSDQFEKVEMEADEREKLRQEVYDAMSDKEKAEAEAKKAGETVEVAMETGEKDESSKKAEEKQDGEKQVTNTDKESLDNKEKQEQDQEVKKTEDKTETSEKKEDAKDQEAEKNENKTENSEKEDAKEQDKEAKKDEDKTKNSEKEDAKEQDKEAKKDEDKSENLEKKEDAKDDSNKEAKPKTETEEKTDKESKDDKDSEDKKEKSEGSEDKESEEGEEKEGEEKEGEESMEEGGTEEEEEGEDTADDVSQDDSPDAENPDDVSNLQLAWEMLELAKLIYAKDPSKEARLRTAESHLKLGEVSMETEQYEEAVKDFNECLTIQKDILEADNRLLAETYYQLGLAYCFAKKFDESVASYQAAIKCIESRITKLDEVLAKATPEEKESKDFDSPVYKAKKEVDDLKELLPDIKSKIDDCEDERKNMDQLKNLAKEALGGLSSSSAPAPDKSEPAKEDVKTTDISHLVKRKRKSEDNEEDKTKKPRQEDGAGDAPVTNGHAEKEEKQTATEAKS